MPGVTPRLTRHNARNAPGILVVMRLLTNVSKMLVRF
eukprot:COSAG02_NODE_41197_length_397_cov_0.697987_1_plen_36_part_01